MRTPEGWTMSLDGWRRALAGDAGGVTLMEAFWSTFHTAALTVTLAVPAGWYMAAQVHRAERGRQGWPASSTCSRWCRWWCPARWWALEACLACCVLPPECWLPRGWPVAHATLVAAIVVRVLLPAMRQMSLTSKHARDVGARTLAALCLVRWPMLRPATVVAAGAALAFSLGEFGT